MSARPIDILIESLRQDYETYRNQCAYKIKAEKDPSFVELKMCIVCDGFKSVSECAFYMDLLHVIKFHEESR